MINVVVVFPKIEDAKSIRNLLVRNGYEVNAVCSSGAQALSAADRLGTGIIVCGYRYPDMVYRELYENLPPSFEMILIASMRVIEEGVCDGVISVAMPLRMHELINSLEMVAGQMERRRKKRRSMPPQRNEKEKKLIAEAKALLMERNHMTEEEAHRYLQKTSMDSGTNLVETAEMLFALMRV
ncbi:MAG: ANTAR domain-containing protein [Lachnospiraceae bacterium]|nr:ANTAR domain-containing protein [Lachnospiraceae bacterium]